MGIFSSDIRTCSDIKSCKLSLMYAGVVTNQHFTSEDVRLSEDALFIGRSKKT